MIAMDKPGKGDTVLTYSSRGILWGTVKRRYKSVLARSDLIDVELEHPNYRTMTCRPDEVLCL